MHVYIVRRSRNWINYDKLTLKNEYPLQSTWDSTFNIKYLDFRKALNKIREENLKNTKFKYIINSTDDPIIRKIANLPNVFIYCTDDDDWYHDDIIDIIESHKDAKFRSYRWCYLQYAPDTCWILRGQVEKWPTGYNYHTNNYVLATPLKFDYKFSCQLEHNNADYAYTNLTDECFINEPLSVYNKTIASRSIYFTRDISRENMIKLYHMALKPPTDIIPPIFHKYLDQLMSLYAKLKIKGIRLL